MKLLLPLVLAAMSAYPSTLSTVTYTPSLPSLFDFVEVNLNGDILVTEAGQIGIVIDGTSPILMYCADVFNLLQFGPVPVIQISSQDYANGGRLSWLYNTYHSTLTQGWQAAALQLAIWEVTADNNNDNLNGGLFQITANTPANVVALTAAMLAASTGQSSTGLTFWEAVDGPSTNQTLLSATPLASTEAPEPANTILLGAGLLLLSLIGKRHL